MGSGSYLSEYQGKSIPFITLNKPQATQIAVVQLTSKNITLFDLNLKTPYIFSARKVTPKDAPIYIDSTKNTNNGAGPIIVGIKINANMITRFII